MPPLPIKQRQFLARFLEKSLSFPSFWVILQPLRCILQCTTSISDRLQHQLLAVKGWMGNLRTSKMTENTGWRPRVRINLRKNMVTNLDLSFLAIYPLKKNNPSSFDMILNTLEFDDNQNIFNCLRARCSRGNPADRKSWKERPEKKNILLIRY